MEEKELLEIEAREQEHAKKNVEEMVRRKRMGDIWLLYKDKFDLKSQKACLSYSTEIPPHALIPIYEKILFQVLPFPSPSVFEREIGCSVDDVVDWRRRGWVETFLASSPRFYRGLNYLDELIQVSPSGSIRTGLYTATLSGGTERFNRLLSKGHVLFGAVKTDERFRRWYGEKNAERHWRGSLASSYADLCAFKLTDIVRWIEEEASNDLDRSGVLAYGSSIFLVEPFLSALKKTCVYASRIRNAAEKIHGAGKPNIETFFVPCWFADLYANLEVIAPQTMDTDEINAVRKHSEDFICAVKSLDEEVDKTVRQKFGGGELDRGEKETIIAKREEFRKRWYEDVVPTFEDISRVKKVWSVTLTGSIVASVVALVALKDILTVPSAMLGALQNREKIMKLVDPAAEFLSTFFECNPIHLGFYKVHKELRKLKRRREN